MLQSTDFSFCAGWMTHCLVSGMFCICVIVWRSWWMEDKPAVQGRLLFQMFHVHKLIVLPHCNCSMHAVQRLIFTALRLWSTFSKLSMTASKSCEGFFWTENTFAHLPFAAATQPYPIQMTTGQCFNNTSLWNNFRRQPKRKERDTSMFKSSAEVHLDLH